MHNRIWVKSLNIEYKDPCARSWSHSTIVLQALWKDSISYSYTMELCFRQYVAINVFFNESTLRPIQSSFRILYLNDKGFFIGRSFSALAPYSPGGQYSTIEELYWSTHEPHISRGIFIMDLECPRDIQIASLVQKLQQFCWICGFCLLVELHWGNPV